MALDAVLQMKELEKPLFTEKPITDDDASEGSMEPLLLSDTEQNDKKGKPNKICFWENS